MELATFCELFAQLRETTGERCGSAREFVDHNAIAPGSIGDRAHIAILLTQIGPEYVLIVDAIQNDKDPAASGPSVHTVQQTAKKCNYCKKRRHVAAQCWKKQREVQPSRDHALKAERTRWEIGRARRLHETEDQYREGEGDDPLYPRTATPVDPGLGRHQPHLLGPGLLQ
ncbi:uncharacterized protein N7446_012647 [Penicillium canescens]|uniref:uncharacterized protein n=1 Tax=Penicillium canescens TaxID=5083 RepID=UPI0026DEA4F3|nr:uncharacterized protein N7446_012647 [Penicillium canescens]KAJ6045783.1 hypothetical protein N7446_012647 [Penicillium canescens]